MSATVLTTDELNLVRTRLRSVGLAVTEPLTSRLISGGRSNLTVELTSGAHHWVLRTPPRAGRTPSAHDVAREFRVTRALTETDVPVPSAIVLHEDERDDGFPFAVWDYVAGDTIQSRKDMEKLGAATVDALVDELVSTLAHLHSVDHVAVGLERFGRPDGFPERQVRRWLNQWELVAPEELRALGENVGAQLRRAMPEQTSVAIVHGDFRIDNTLIVPASRPERLAVSAVLDWELSTIGDPVADVAIMCAYRHPAFDLIVGEPAAWTSTCLPSENELAARYEAAAGKPLKAWPFYLGLAYFRIAVIAAGIDHRYRAGAASGSGFDTSGAAVESYLVLAGNSVHGA